MLAMRLGGDRVVVVSVVLCEGFMLWEVVERSSHIDMIPVGFIPARGRCHGILCNYVLFDTKGIRYCH